MTWQSGNQTSSPSFDHLLCAECGVCLIFQKYIPVFEAARQIGCQYGRRRIWSTPCPKCSGEMEVTFISEIAETLLMDCCQNRTRRLKRKSVARKIVGSILVAVTFMMLI